MQGHHVVANLRTQKQCNFRQRTFRVTKHAHACSALICIVRRYYHSNCFMWCWLNFVCRTWMSNLHVFVKLNFEWRSNYYTLNWYSEWPAQRNFSFLRCVCVWVWDCVIFANEQNQQICKLSEGGRCKPHSFSRLLNFIYWVYSITRKPSSKFGSLLFASTSEFLQICKPTFVSCSHLNDTLFYSDTNPSNL